MRHSGRRGRGWVERITKEECAKKSLTGWMVPLLAGIVAPGGRGEGGRVGGAEVR